MICFNNESKSPLHPEKSDYMLANATFSLTFIININNFLNSLTQVKMKYVSEDRTDHSSHK